MSYLFHLFFYDPLYNALVFLIDIIPTADVGLAVIILTIFVKLILFPLSQKALETQTKVKGVQKEIDALKKQYQSKENREKLALETMAVYKRNNINPFAGFLTILIQIPLVFALYFIFSKGLPMIQVDLLYPFISIPPSPNMELLGVFNVAEKSIVAALLVGITQFFQAKFAFSGSGKIEIDPNNKSFSNDFMKGLQIQMKYVFPVIMTVVSASVIAVLPLYWIVGNLFMIGQELYLRKKKAI